MAISVTDTGLVVDTQHGTQLLSWLWLRDHSRDETSFLVDSHQRTVDTHRLGEIGVPDIDLAGAEVTLRWTDGAVTTFLTDDLVRLASPGAMYPHRPQTIETWNAERIEQILEAVPPVSAADFLASDDAVAVVLESLSRYGLGLLSDASADRDSTQPLLERIAYVRESIFGGLWDIRSDGEFADSGSTNLEVTPHTDGTYSHDAPGVIGFHCLQPADEGGESVLVDGFAVATMIAETDPDAYAILTTVDIPGQYVGDGANLIARRPVLRLGGPSGVEPEQISYNNHDRAPFVLPEPQMSDLYRALGVFDTAIRNPQFQFRRQLASGDLVFFDNWRVLHAREAFSGARHFSGGYLNREDVESRTRLLLG